MTYNVLMGTFNPTHSLTHSLTHWMEFDEIFSVNSNKKTQLVLTNLLVAFRDQLR